MADLSGKPVEALPKLKDRKFVEINPDNFDTVLEKMKPHLSFSVRDRLSEDPLSLEVAAAEDPNAPRLKVNIDFNSLQDFEPDRVAEKVPPLKQLLDLRRSLTDLKGSLQGNDKLEELLQAAITETEQRVKLRAELNLPEEPAK
jgi:type VI secretion system protein ImpB